MKRLFFIIGLTLLLVMLLVACTKPSDTKSYAIESYTIESRDTVSIITNVNKYSPMMSSIQGITMKPDFKSNKTYTKLEYHWVTEEGEFLNLGKDVNNEGGSVLWTAVGNNTVISIKNDFNIRLEVIDSKSKEVLANTKLTIHPNEIFYEVVKPSNDVANAIYSTANNCSPEVVLKTDPNADFFIMNNTVYMNAERITWVKKLTRKGEKVLGTISKTGVKEDFKDWNSTSLAVGTIIYELVGREDIVVIKIDGKWIPYLKYVEG